MKEFYTKTMKKKHKDPSKKKLEGNWIKQPLLDREIVAENQKLPHLQDKPIKYLLKR